jgi:serine/threonine-protein kinase
MPLVEGQTIDGKYRIVRLIGQGGIGAVYEGENILIRRRVAIKVLLASAAANKDLILRFEREAQAAGAIGNDHILEVLDLGSLPNGDRYMVMEYLDGETLADRMQRFQRLTPGQLAPLARQFLTALASAHAAGIIHRDLKPENIFILRTKAGRTDFVKLIDFGVSKFSNMNEQLRMTRAGAVLGTPCYMSPEQARGRAETDVRSDIYSCGVILYEAVTGKLPFEAETFNDLMFKIALSDPPSPLALVPSLDPDFAWIIGRAMARNPEERFQTVRELAETLDGWMRRNSLTGTLTQPPPTDAYPSSRISQPNITPPSQPRISNKEGATIVESLDDDVDLLQFQKTGTSESWAHSAGDGALPPKKRNMPAIAAVSVAALVAVAIAIALLVSTAGNKSMANQAPSASASIPEPPPSATESPPTSAIAPSTSSPSPPVTATPTTATAASTANGNATAHSTARPPAPKPKPKPATSGKPLDFGY